VEQDSDIGGGMIFRIQEEETREDSQNDNLK
jgi:hypothetical protein